MGCPWEHYPHCKDIHREQVEVVIPPQGEDSNPEEVEEDLDGPDQTPSQVKPCNLLLQGMHSQLSEQL